MTEDGSDRTNGEDRRTAVPPAGAGEAGRHRDAELAALREDVDALADTLERLEGELTPGRGRRFGRPTVRDFRRFTADVTIPLVILVLETNVRALRIFQRALRSGTTDGDRLERTASRRAADVSRQTLDRLEGVLADLQDSVSPGDPGDPVGGLIEEATSLQERVSAELAAIDDADTRGEPDWPDEDSDTVSIDVDAELESIKNQIGDEDEDEDDEGDSDDA